MLKIRPALCIAVLMTSFGALRASDAYQWSVQYLIDNSQSVFGRPQNVWPRQNRGLALSPDGKYLYAGYLHSFGGGGEVRRIQVGAPNYQLATEMVLPGVMAKAIATDDKGRVYLCGGSSVFVYNAALDERLLSIQAGFCEGVAVAREAGKLILYTTDRQTATVRRWELAESNAGLASAKLAGLGGTGMMKVEGATDLRGIRVDSKGRLFVADLKGGKVFRIEPQGSAVTSVSVQSPIDLAISGERLLVTGWSSRAITVMDLDLKIIGNLNAPWEELELSPLGNNHTGALAGIAVLPGKGFFVANEGGQTASQKSTYGEPDGSSGIVNDKLWQDAVADDNEPILRGLEVTPAP